MVRAPPLRPPPLRIILDPVSDALSAIGGFALIVGLFAAYIAQRVAARRAKAPQPAPLPAPEPPPHAVAAGPAEPARSSINWGAPFLYCTLLTVAARAGPVWSTICLVGYAVFVVVGAYSTFSPKELAEEQRRRPGTTRWEHYGKTGFPYVLVPTVS